MARRRSQVNATGAVGRTAAGGRNDICLVVAGAVVLMGIITAEPCARVYTTHNNEVSDLGAAAQ
jgi:hypothetical protein